MHIHQSAPSLLNNFSNTKFEREGGRKKYAHTHTFNDTCKEKEEPGLAAIHQTVNPFDLDMYTFLVCIVHTNINRHNSCKITCSQTEVKATAAKYATALNSNGNNHYNYSNNNKNTINRNSRYPQVCVCMKIEVKRYPIHHRRSAEWFVIVRSLCILYIHACLFECEFVRLCIKYIFIKTDNIHSYTHKSATAHT